MLKQKNAPTNARHNAFHIVRVNIKEIWETCDYACEVVCANRKDVFSGRGPPAIITRLKQSFHPPPQ